MTSEDGGFATWLATLSEEELPLRGHLVADVAVARVAAGVADLDVLTVEER
ncbi:hypothetical protein [Sphingomonas sp. Leaf25]|uniref:hypothetical protein n=1 Tax=Sphingomonas sp. Leaf25 TaxID=1735692 RepID=UPI001F418229|nr:hypothetical protein [Sphingomonas sp. Leaf25]